MRWKRNSCLNSSEKQNSVLIKEDEIDSSQVLKNTINNICSRFSVNHDKEISHNQSMHDSSDSNLFSDHTTQHKNVCFLSLKV